MEADTETKVEIEAILGRFAGVDYNLGQRTLIREAIEVLSGNEEQIDAQIQALLEKPGADFLLDGDPRLGVNGQMRILNPLNKIQQGLKELVNNN